MDLTRIKTVVLNQLTNTNGLYSLKLQNHIYGCFIVMEDIAQRAVDISGTLLVNPKYVFDFDKQFNEIGLRYGFAMDSKLSLDTYTIEYKNTWLELFNDIDLAQNIDEVDNIEDCIIEIIQNNIKPDDAFFLSALESGSLPQEWIEKVFLLLNPAPPSSPTDKDEETVDNMLSKANSEKPTKRHLATTRRVNPKITITKKALAKTRRHR